MMARFAFFFAALACIVVTSTAESETQSAECASPMGASLLQSADSIKKANLFAGKLFATETTGDEVLPLPPKETAVEPHLFAGKLFATESVGGEVLPLLLQETAVEQLPPKETAKEPERQKSPASLAQGKWWSSHHENDVSVYREEDPVVYYAAKYVLPSNAEDEGHTPPMAVANAAADSEVKKAKDLGVDFEGIWWMSDNPVPEELVSFAGMKVETTNGGFPITLKVPNAKKRMWSWLDTTIGKKLRQFYATGDPEAHTDFIFSSAIEGEITTGLKTLPLVWVDSFKFYKYTADCDKTSGSAQACDPTDCAPKGSNLTCADLIARYPNDMWSRPTKFQSGSLFSDATYTLKRIVMGDGSPHPVFWNEFMDHMTSEPTTKCPFFCEKTPGKRGEKVLQTYMSDDWCTRKNHAWIFGITGC